MRWDFGGESKDATFQETTQKIWHYLEKQKHLVIRMISNYY